VRGRSLPRDPARRRVAQGAAAALLLPSSLSLIRGTYPDAGERARAIGIWAAIGGGALAAGPVLGGVLTDGIDWRAIFVINCS
jgi:DHA2 family methylenomycin A resistance protein-like MFS transporter